MRLKVKGNSCQMTNSSLLTNMLKLLKFYSTTGALEGVYGLPNLASVVTHVLVDKGNTAGLTPYPTCGSRYDRPSENHNSHTGQSSLSLH